MSVYHTEKYPIRQTKPGVFLIYKEPGETLAVLLDRFRLEQGIGSDIPLTYAGRLDPMACGLVILLSGEMCKNKDEFLGYDKEYEAEVLFGLGTDTYDMLGLVTDIQELKPDETEVVRVLDIVSKQTEFPYPPYSSKPVDGVPLFSHARAGTLPISIPSVKGGIKDINLISLQQERLIDVIERSKDIIRRVSGDFRQTEILEQWDRYLQLYPEQLVTIAKIRTTVSSGMYIRSLAVALGKVFDGPALALSINRTEIGEYK